MANLEETKLRIEEFCNRLFDLYILHNKRMGYTFASEIFTVEYGKKNARIVVDSGQRSVYCFVELLTGDILKAAGWKAPAAGKRGSIWNEDCDVGFDKPANVYGSGLYAR